MYRLEYTPRALDDLKRIKEYITIQFGTSVAEKRMRQLTQTARQLEQFPNQGLNLAEVLPIETDYRYLIIKPNYVFYQLEMNRVRVVRVLNEKQDFMQILFGVTGVSEENTEYWEG